MEGGDSDDQIQPIQKIKSVDTVKNSKVDEYAPTQYNDETEILNELAKLEYAQKKPSNSKKIFKP
jgi:cell fate (sporulation/competence/biofilm development) regulator YmcA (YheA/YmcA/DUF963 family)